MHNTQPTWISCQLGAREHYAIPRALYQGQMLRSLVTDAWVNQRDSALLRHTKLRERYHSGLATAPIVSWNWPLITFEILAKARRLKGWRLIEARNGWFQRKAVATLATLSVDGSPRSKSPPVIFSYSYTALEPFRLAKKRGWRTVLGQIDSGPISERIASTLDQDPRWRGTTSNLVPPTYWPSWRSECRLADRIIVNSQWSQQSLIEEGVQSEKIRVIPLAYQTPSEAATFIRHYPASFSSSRPMRVLFLGQVTLLKGIRPLLEAAQSLSSEPIEFWIVGPLQLEIPQELKTKAKIRWVGRVARGATSVFYREADLFIFPTYCDGFGLTQLEAQAWKLPVISSKFCGDVVQDGTNGVLLGEVTSQSIANTLKRCRDHPKLLSEFSKHSVSTDSYGISQLELALRDLF